VIPVQSFIWRIDRSKKFVLCPLCLSGILVFTGLTVIFSYTNRVVKREVARHVKFSHFSLGVAAMNGLTAVIFTHMMLTEKVYNRYGSMSSHWHFESKLFPIC
jgi:hypothetical protein